MKQRGEMLRQLRAWSRSHGGQLRIAFALFLVVGASVLFWASRDYTVVAPDWDGQVRGVAVGLTRLGKVVILRHNKPADPETFKGVYRLRFPTETD